jgi:chaperonin GroES
MIKPLFKNILVKNTENEKQTASGIIIPDKAQKESQIAEVLAVGDDKDVTIKKGDKIIYKKWGGNEIEVDREKFIVIEEKDILAIIQ